jgi:hypothetical protein
LSVTISTARRRWVRFSCRKRTAASSTRLLDEGPAPELPPEHVVLDCAVHGIQIFRERRHHSASVVENHHTDAVAFLKLVETFMRGRSDLPHDDLHAAADIKE